MPTPSITREEAENRFRLIQEYLDKGYATRGEPSRSGQQGAVQAACESTGLSPGTSTSWLRAAERVMGHKFPFPPPGSTRTVDNELDIPKDLPSSDRSVEELLIDREREFLRKQEAEEARRIIPVKVKIKGPVGIAFFGDPHVDDPGTDIIALRRHLDVVHQTEGMFGGNVGDLHNNWIGRLAHLYAEQQTTQSEAWKLVEWMVNYPIWLFLIAGNHDVWSGARDPVRWMVRNRKAIYHQHGARIGLKFPNGKEVRVNCRHDFAGHSMWNTAHGPMKAAQSGWADHLMVCGHKHTSGYGLVKDAGSGLISHCLRVAGYKKYDEYAAKLGLPDQNVSPAFVTIIDPQYDDDDPRLIQTILDVEEAAEYLTWKRGK